MDIKGIFNPLFRASALYGMMGMSESIEVQMARMQERMVNVTAELERNTNSRERGHEIMETLSDKLDQLRNRMEKVENQLASNAPTIEEFITIKHQVRGAGILGRWIWAGGGMLIAFVFSMREQIRAFFF